MTLPSALSALVTILAPRAASLAVMIFGDSIAQQGNSVWLGGLVTVMQQFGLNARQTRTAIFRLGREGWLTPQLSGRRSYYSFTESGERQYARAAERIHASAAADWDGHWTLITGVGLAGVLREELRRRLRWLGFGSPGGGLLLSVGIGKCIGALTAAQRRLPRALRWLVLNVARSTRPSLN